MTFLQLCNTMHWEACLWWRVPRTGDPWWSWSYTKVLTAHWGRKKSLVQWVKKPFGTKCRVPWCAQKGDLTDWGLGSQRELPGEGDGLLRCEGQALLSKMGAGKGVKSVLEERKSLCKGQKVGEKMTHKTVGESTGCGWEEVRKRLEKEAEVTT